MDDTESCSSRALDSVPTQTRKRMQKFEVYHEVLRRLKESQNEEASQPGFEDELWAHFNRLPSRYCVFSIASHPGTVCLCVSLSSLLVYWYVFSCFCSFTLTFLSIFPTVIIFRLFLTSIWCYSFTLIIKNSSL